MATTTSVRYSWRGTSIAVQLEAAVEEALEQTGRAAQEVARQHARVLTGAMRESIASSVERVASGRQLTLSIGVPYGVFHEVGTSRMAAQPMLRPAIDIEGPKITGRIRAAAARIR